MILDLCFIFDNRNRIDKRGSKVVGKMEKKIIGKCFRNGSVLVKEVGVFGGLAGFRWFLIKFREISGLCLLRV